MLVVGVDEWEQTTFTIPAEPGPWWLVSADGRWSFVHTGELLASNASVHRQPVGDGEGVPLADSVRLGHTSARVLMFATPDVRDEMDVKVHRVD